MFYHCITFYVYITHAKDKHTDKLAKIGITIDFISIVPLLLYFDYIYSGLRNYFICREKWKT